MTESIFFSIKQTLKIAYFSIAYIHTCTDKQMLAIMQSLYETALDCTNLCADFDVSTRAALVVSLHQFENGVRAGRSAHHTLMVLQQGFLLKHSRTLTTRPANLQH